MLGSKPSKVQVAVLVAALNVTGVVTTTEVLLWRFTQDQES